MKTSNVWTIEDVMEYTGLGRKTVTRLLLSPECPTLPRRKGQKFLVRREAFERWFTSV